MISNPPFNKNLLRMAGIAGILVGVLILTFAIVSDLNKIFFYDAIYRGGSVDPWLQNVLASPSLSRFITVLPVLGFSCMLIVTIVLYQYIPENSWQKNLALTGHAIGVPVAVGSFIAQLSLMNEALLLYGKSAEMDVQFQLITSVRLHFFHVVNHIFGPFFIIILGTTMMAWAALKASVLPRWICIWLITCGVMMFISFFGFLIPVLRLVDIGAPLHMLGCSMLGLILLRRSLA